MSELLGDSEELNTKKGAFAVVESDEIEDRVELVVGGVIVRATDHSAVAEFNMTKQADKINAAYAESVEGLVDRLRAMAEAWHDLYCVPDFPHHIKPDFAGCPMGYCEANRKALAEFQGGERS